MPDIDAHNDPELAAAAGEVAAWVEYLLHPHTHDGPRVYRDRMPDHPDGRDAEMPRRMPNLDEQSHRYDTVSVLEDFAADPTAFIRSAQAVSGVTDAAIDAAYAKLTQACFILPDLDSAGGQRGSATNPPGVHLSYPELHPARFDWAQMRKSWVAPESNYAHEFEGDFIAFQVYTENCLFVVAEHLVKYRAIFRKAAEDITALMKALTEIFARTSPYSGGLTFDLRSVIITTIVGIATTLISGGATVAKVFGVALTELLGEATKTAQDSEKKLLLENHLHLRDVAYQYLDGVGRIEQEAAEAVRNLYNELRITLDRLREDRKYSDKPLSDVTRATVPHIRDYH
ncbi:hypothetical protein [Actinokineospora sp. UTMC 2448]|uniref:hypothetical protein n=1 Tax=Actinokineospora sp. UTMC 2448 TaxID=2268449 RepID=UPI002164A7FC|nr:hypothetical protein [Actinokineospora sp. UTMC 2448]